MHDTQLVMYDEDFRKVLAVTQRLVKDASAKGVFVVDRNGQLISEAGELRGIDTTSLASLTAGSVAATVVCGFSDGRLGSRPVSEKKPELIYFPAKRNFCPVCGEVSYSRSGEHPQCSVARADAAFKARQKKRDTHKPTQLAAKRH